MTDRSGCGRCGPLFRHERPQRGRFRQFHQVNVEALGFAGPDIDAEQIVMLARLWKTLGITSARLEINCLGQADERAHHRAELVTYFAAACMTCSMPTQSAG